MDETRIGHVRTARKRADEEEEDEQHNLKTPKIFKIKEFVMEHREAELLQSISNA